MTVTQDLSIVSLIAQASVLVQLVMALLGGLSLVSWYWIFRKLFQIRSARAKTAEFERDFWSGGDLNALFQSANAARHHSGGMERIFEAGYREFTKLRAKSHDHDAIIEGARRAMRATYQREVDDLEAHLAFLASVGSVSPYIGLLGTVWGIMNAFRGLANMSSATPSACSLPFRPWSPTTVSPMTSTGSASASRASWRNSPISCSASCAEATGGFRCVSAA